MAITYDEDGTQTGSISERQQIKKKDETLLERLKRQKDEKQKLIDSM